MTNWMWILLIFLWLGGASWIVDTTRKALKTRHKRRLELEQETTRRTLADQAANQPPQPICGCTHHLAKHDRSTGKCHEQVQTPVTWDAERKPVQFEARQCNCQQYIGPEPLGTVYAPEIVDPG